jgi:hypothetical protein
MSITANRMRWAPDSKVDTVTITVPVADQAKLTDALARVLVAAGSNEHLTQEDSEAIDYLRQLAYLLEDT